MGTPLGDFIRARRDDTRPEDLGLPVHGRRRAPGLRRTELAERAGISVEYLTRIEQGRNRNPSWSVINGIADALSLDISDRRHLMHLAKVTGGGRTVHFQDEPAMTTVRPQVRQTLELLEPGIAMVTNGPGDLLAYTIGFELIFQPTGLLEPDSPNLTNYVFTDPRAKDTFLDWHHVADEQAFTFPHCAGTTGAEQFADGLTPRVRADFTHRLERRSRPPRTPLRVNHPSGHELRFDRESLEVSHDAQEIVVLLPADEGTSRAVTQLRRDQGTGYTSEHAFSRAFRQACGQPPGRYRATFRGETGPI